MVALEGEFALTEGHAQELKNIALAQQVGKRLRVIVSQNNAGIDDSLVGGVVKKRYTDYDLARQWVSWGWNVFTVENGNDFDQVLAAFKAMEEWPADDRRPMILVGPTVKGWWPAARDGRIGAREQIVGYPSHPYAFEMNGDYFIGLAESFEQAYGIRFDGIRDGVPATEPERLIQFKTNVDAVMSVMERRPGLRAWIAERVLDVAGTVDRAPSLRIDPSANPMLDARLRVENLPVEAQDVVVPNPHTGEDVERRIALFLEPGEKKGPRRAVSEIGAWLNYVTGGRFMTMAADLSGSINVEKANLLGHYDPVENPYGTRLKAAIQEAGNASTIIGLVSQNASTDPGGYAGVWGISGTYGAFTPLMYTPARVFSQMNQDSPFELGVLHVLAGHSGPETAADARTHFGIFAPQVWTLLPRGQVVNLYFWDYNDVAPGYFAAVQQALAVKEIGIIVIHVAAAGLRGGGPVDLCRYRPEGRGEGALSDPRPRPRRAADGHRLRAGIELDEESGQRDSAPRCRGPQRARRVGHQYRAVRCPAGGVPGEAAARRRALRLHDRQYDDQAGAADSQSRRPTEEYSLYADFDDRWRSGGMEPDVIAEAHLDEESIYQGIARFVRNASPGWSGSGVRWRRFDEYECSFRVTVDHAGHGSRPVAGARPGAGPGTVRRRLHAGDRRHAAAAGRR